jgi:hypothetical protein
VLAAGATGIAAGSFLISGVDAGDGYLATVLPGMLIAGVGMGLALVALQVAVFVEVAEQDSGIVAGLFTTSQEVASAVGQRPLSRWPSLMVMAQAESGSL